MLEVGCDNISAAWSWLGSCDIGRQYAGCLFGNIQSAVMPKLTEHAPDELGALVRTMSFYARLSPDQRQALDREHEAIYQRLGRPIRASMIAVLITAQRRADPAGGERTAMTQAPDQQYQDLHLFGDVAAREQRQPAEQPDHEQIDQAEEHECRG